MAPVVARSLTLGALCVAALALVASCVAAVGPANSDRAEYTWPPERLPDVSPSEGWYAPLPLLNRVPSAIEVRLPCALSPPLRKAASVSALSTARRPRDEVALWLTLRTGSIRIGVGRTEIASVPWPASCPLRLEIRNGELRVPGRTVRLRTGTLDDMPIVTGILTGLDISAANSPQVRIQTRAYATSPTAMQIVAAGAALTLALVSLLLISIQPGPRRAARPLRRLSRAWRAGDRTDALVVGTLLVWWIVGPTYADDGWLWVESRAFDDLGTLGFYFDVWGVGLPVGYWIEWLRQWVVGSTADLVVMRIPTLLALLVSWLLCRWCMNRTVPRPIPCATRWTLAGVFLVGAMAWGMTLRLEPFVLLLMLICLTAMVSFSLAPRMGSLAIAMSAALLAVTAHPVGLVVFAPLLASAATVMGALRRGHLRLVGVAALLLASFALGVVLLTLDSDLATRLADARIARGNEFHGDLWWQEHLRYVRFEEHGGGTAPRRLSLALLLLVVFAWLTRWRAAETGVLVLPARTVVFALVLLALVPSKWPWHFGAIVGAGAVAIAAEITRLIRERDQGAPPVRLITAVSMLAVAASWAWLSPGGWGPLDLQETSWSYGFNALTLVGLLALVVLAVAVGRARARGGGLELLAGWTIPIVTLAVCTVTAATLVHDAVNTSWSPARQNLEALAGGSSCGLAHQLDDGGDVAGSLADPAVPTLLVPTVGLYFPCATIPRLDGGLVEVPRLIVFNSSPWPLFETDRPFAATRDLYRQTSVARGPREVEVFLVAADIPGFARVDAVRRDGS